MSHILKVFFTKNSVYRIYNLFLLPILFSCVNTKNAIYFDAIQNTEIESAIENIEPIIQKNDLLSITVSSLNPAATEIFNVSSTTAIRNPTATNTISQVAGYLVDQDGEIQFPILGNIKAAGISKKELQNEIKKEIIERKLLIDPVIDIRFLNYKVSILGEVARPSVLTVPNERITLLEALGLAGDLTIYASRNNVLLIREEEGKKKLTRIDLTTSELFSSPYYYLKSNDIIYVEPNKNRIVIASASRQWIPVILSSLTLVMVSINRLLR